ncbi:MAG: hypothetical protein ABF449_12205, partial [Ethanoligenens sp.]
MSNQSDGRAPSERRDRQQRQRGNVSYSARFRPPVSRGNAPPVPIRRSRAHSPGPDGDSFIPANSAYSSAPPTSATPAPGGAFTRAPPWAGKPRPQANRARAPADS